MKPGIFVVATPEQVYTNDGAVNSSRRHIKLEHVQSRERVQVESFDEAVAWVERRANSPPLKKGKGELGCEDE